MDAAGVPRLCPALHDSAVHDHEPSLAHLYPAPEETVKFKTTLFKAEDMNATGIVIPPEIIATLGGGKRAPVRITINGYTYRNTVAVMGGQFMVGVAAEHRDRAKVKGGDAIEVTIELDDAPRTVAVPADFAAALSKAKARDAFDGLAHSHR